LVVVLWEKWVVVLGEMEIGGGVSGVRHHPVKWFACLGCHLEWGSVGFKVTGGNTMEYSWAWLGGVLKELLVESLTDV
jgi:hypothetical protein